MKKALRASITPDGHVTATEALSLCQLRQKNEPISEVAKPKFGGDVKVWAEDEFHSLRKEGRRKA
jgi:hypothetical protein